MRMLWRVGVLLGLMRCGEGTKMTLLWDNTGQGGFCMDGSAGGFYYAPAVNANSTLWVFDFQGGGACYTKESCDSRAKGNLGSSKNWPASITGSKFLDDDPGSNPDFYDSYKVRVPYCSGDTHTGMRTEADSTSFGYYFSGHLKVRNMISILLKSDDYGPRLNAATHVLVTGTSAGGRGTFANVDFIQSQLPWAKVKAIPIAGFYFPGYTDDQTESVLPPSGWWRWKFNQTGSASFSDGQVDELYQSYKQPGCLESVPADKGFLCSSVAAFYPFIKAPVLILENQFDTNKMYTQLSAPQTASIDPQVRAYVAYYGRSVRATISPSNLKSGDGAFLPSCHTHVGGLGVKGTTTIPSAPTQQKLCGDWFWERGDDTKHMWIDTCQSADELPCNPTCEGIPLGCEPELVKLGCTTVGEMACRTCALSHETRLGKAGCTRNKVKLLCEAIAPVSSDGSVGDWAPGFATVETPSSGGVVRCSAVMMIMMVMAAVL
eukprot:Hpha_TRINITY_DN5367_c0_g1::TRINITY_DN5367_c0_g1_i1::g.32761::m.32761/K19882/NOTUM; O-palmitoleoyl-L-serine hydrolase